MEMMGEATFPAATKKCVGKDYSFNFKRADTY